ncbi:Fe-regulated protein 8 [Vanrija pseudolonga]|uniref:Fe-regulated protein 8 n=1 Tax=Vanrija pseudolonga TaxID=143232 RepID=A0AAF1BPL7_9TREE|nr:Fe-regulated protein 8 [Vanrija pseudolonga]
MTDTETHKNVVIIGASFAGHALANRLASALPARYRVILVEQNEFAVHLPALVRAVVVPGSENDKLTGRLSQDTVFPKASRHRLVRAKVVSLRARSILLDTEFEGSAEVPFERCVVATGATQAPPLRPAPGSTLEEYRVLLRKVQSDMAAAESILIVGGGAVGVEVAGELSHQYPGKKVTLVHSRSRLLLTSDSVPGKPGEEGFSYAPVPEWVGESLESQLRQRGVDVALDERVVFPSKSAVDEPDGWDGRTGVLGGTHSIPLTSGRRIDADYMFASPGNRPNSALVGALDPEATSAAGHVLVDGEFRVLSDEAALARVYALGDVASQAGRKTAGLAVYESYFASMAIVAHIKAYEEGREEAAKAYTPPDLRSIVVPLGDGTGEAIGAGVIDLRWFGLWAAPRWIIRWFAKDYFVRNFYTLFKGSEGCK